MACLLPLLLLQLLAGCAGEAVREDSAIVADSLPGDLLVTVVDRSTGAPVPAAWVVAAPGGRDAETDAEGVARFPRLAAGDYTLTATVAGYGDTTGAVTVGDAGGRAQLGVAQRAAGTGGMRGYVLAPGAEALPVEGARILVDGAVVAESDTNGEWSAVNLSAGPHTLRVEPPIGSSMLAWEGAHTLEVTEGEGTITAVTLPGSPPADADFVGSEACAECHADTGHGHTGALFSRGAVEAAGMTDLTDAFAGGAVISLGGDATVTLGADWSMAIDDGRGGQTGALPITAVYGGPRQGVAFGLDLDGQTRVAPVAWALGQGPGAEDGWATTWADTWLDPSGRRQDGTADWVLECAGCHVTGHKLDQEGGVYVLAPVGGGEVEEGVGCESCHGPGSTHADDQLATSILDPSDLPPAWQDDGCGRCHAATTPSASPFSAKPAWPIDSQGVFVGPGEPLSAHTTSTPDRWDTVAVSRVAGDQVGDFATAPHRTGAWLGSCQDCHDPHGSEHTAGLRQDPADRALCTSCHAAAFPDDTALLAHSGHWETSDTTWGPSTCTGCHFPRSGVRLQPDPLSGIGEEHAHTMLPWSPARTVEAFDLAGVDTLALGEAPSSPCLDCHLQARAQAELDGVGLGAPAGDATLRSTHETLADLYTRLFPEGP